MTKKFQFCSSCELSLGGCDSTIKAVEETNLVKTIKPFTIYNKEQQEEEPSKVINEMIEENKVTIFSKSFCPHCKKVKGFFNTNNIHFKALELDLMGIQGTKIQTILKERTGQTTVPNVWINGRFVGENSIRLTAGHSVILLQFIWFQKIISI